VAGRIIGLPATKPSRVLTTALTGGRVLKLHLPSGATKFASRQAYRLPYECQRETPRYRSLGRAWKARKRLNSIGGIGDPCFRPKWMRRKTFDRLMGES